MAENKKVEFQTPVSICGYNTLFRPERDNKGKLKSVVFLKIPKDGNQAHAAAIKKLFDAQEFLINSSFSESRRKFAARCIKDGDREITKQERSDSIKRLLAKYEKEEDAIAEYEKRIAADRNCWTLVVKSFPLEEDKPFPVVLNVPPKPVACSQEIFGMNPKVVVRGVFYAYDNENFGVTALMNVVYVIEKGKPLQGRDIGYDSSIPSYEGPVTEDVESDSIKF